MARSLMNRWTAVLLLGVLVAFGCSRSAPPLEPLAEAEVPTAIQTAFAKAKPEIKAEADQVLAALQAKDYSKAYLGLQNLTLTGNLNKEQQSVAARAALTVNGMLQNAQTQGDTKAAETLKTYRVNK